MLDICHEEESEDSTYSQEGIINVDRYWSLVTPWLNGENCQAPTSARLDYSVTGDHEKFLFWFHEIEYNEKRLHQGSGVKDHSI